MHTYLRRQIDDGFVENQGQKACIPALLNVRAYGKEAVLITLVDSYATRHILNGGNRMALGLAEDWKPPRS